MSVPKVGDRVLYGGADGPVEEVEIIEVSRAGDYFLGAERDFLSRHTMSGSDRASVIRGGFDSARWHRTARILEWLDRAEV